MAIKYTEIKTTIRGCSSCRAETEQTKAEGEYICLTCLMNPKTEMSEKTGQPKQGELYE